MYTFCDVINFRRVSYIIVRRKHYLYSSENVKCKTTDELIKTYNLSNIYLSNKLQMYIK